MKFRPRSVADLPIEKKARYLATLPTVSDTIAARALINYHLERQRPMMGAFLDSLGITHENGLISDEAASKPDEGKLERAAPPRPRPVRGAARATRGRADRNPDRNTRPRLPPMDRRPRRSSSTRAAWTDGQATSNAGRSLLHLRPREPGAFPATRCRPRETSGCPASAPAVRCRPTAR